MHGSFSVDPGSLRDGGRSLDGAAERVDEAVRRLRAAIADAREPWGHDRPGRAFAAHYCCGAQGAFARFASLPDALAMAGAGLRRMADDYEAADLTSAPEP